MHLIDTQGRAQASRLGQRTASLSERLQSDREQVRRGTSRAISRMHIDGVQLRGLRADQHLIKRAKELRPAMIASLEPRCLLSEHVNRATRPFEEAAVQVDCITRHLRLLGANA
jgi:hypothetical protein